MLKVGLKKGVFMTLIDNKMIIATFRFGIISELINRTNLSYGDKEKILIEKSEQFFKHPTRGFSVQFSKSSIKQWVKLYNDSGRKIESLFPKPRKDRGKIRSIDDEIQDKILQYKIANPDETIPTLLKKMKNDKILSLDENIRPSTIYRFLKNKSSEIKKAPKDRKKFETELPNDLWQSDVMHGPKVKNGSKSQKTYLHAIIDDHSRLIIHAEFFLNEQVETYKLCLKKGLEKRGLPRKLYVDNGACFSAINLEQITACLGISICHTPPYTPQGRGKIERWFKTVRDSFLPLLEENITLSEINLQLNNWVQEYNNSEHSATGLTPINKYILKSECIRPAPPQLMDYFRVIQTRLMNKDRTFRLNGMLYEGPAVLIDKKIDLKFHFEDNKNIEIFFNDKSFGMAKILNPYLNSKRNDKNKNELASGQVF